MFARVLWSLWTVTYVQSPSLKDVRDRKILHKIFFNKIQYTIIQAILSRKSMKKFTVTDEKIALVYKAFDRKK